MEGAAFRIIWGFYRILKENLQKLPVSFKSIRALVYYLFRAFFNLRQKN